MVHARYLGLLTASASVLASSCTGRSGSPATQLPTTEVPAGDVSALLADPPAAGETVEIEAYFGRVQAPLGGEGLGGSGNRTRACPGARMPLTDQPFPEALSLFHACGANPLLEEAAWLMASGDTKALEEAESEVLYWTRQLEVPFAARRTRLRGHLGDPDYADCAMAERYFVVEEVLEISPPEPTIPEGLLDEERWESYRHPGLGFRLLHPTGWRLDDADPARLVLSSTDWPRYPMGVSLKL